MPRSRLRQRPASGLTAECSKTILETDDCDSQETHSWNFASRGETSCLNCVEEPRNRDTTRSWSPPGQHCEERFARTELCPSKIVPVAFGGLSSKGSRSLRGCLIRTPIRISALAAVLFLILANVAVSASEFTVKDIGQLNPMAGGRNTITVTIQSTQMLSGLNASVVSIQNLAGLSGFSPIELDTAAGGAGGDALFCFDGVSPATATLESDNLELSLCANRTLQANTSYAFSFSFVNPMLDQGPIVVMISANGTQSVPASSMVSANNTAAGISGGAAPLYLVQPRLSLRELGQTRPLVSVVNTLVLTMAANIDLVGADSWEVSMTGLSGTAQPVGPVHIETSVGGIRHVLFCYGGQQGAGWWGGDSLLLQLCASSTVQAQTRYLVSFNVTNGNAEQASPAISVQARGVVNVSTVAVDKPDTVLIGVALGSNPLVMVTPLLVSANITQSTPAAGSFNVLTVALSTSVDLRSQESSQITLSGLAGAQAEAIVLLQDVDGGSGADELFCVGSEVAAGEWASLFETLTLSLCPGFSLLAGVSYAFAFTVTNPAAAQGPAAVQIETSGTAGIGPATVSAPAFEVLGIQDGSQPLLVKVPEMRVRAMGQSTLLPGRTNTISLTMQPNIDMLSTDFSRLTLSGLPPVSTNNQVLDLPLSGGNASGLFSPYSPPAITIDAAAWDSSNGIVLLFLYRNQMLHAGASYLLSFEFQNPTTARSSPDIFISASGTAEFLPSLVAKPGRPLLGVPNGADPFLTYIPELTVRSIQQSTPEFRAVNTMTLSLQSNVDLYGSDGSALTVSGFPNAILGANVTLGGNMTAVSKFCRSGTAGQATWSSASEAITLELCPTEQLSAGELIVLTFNVTNPARPQQAVPGSIAVTGTATFSAELEVPGPGKSLLEVPGGADPMEVVIVLYWNELNVTLGPSKGGTLVPIYGLHLSEGGGNFSCLFENDDLPAGVEVDAAIVSDTQLTCTTPAWPIRGGHARLRLKYEGIRIPYAALTAINHNGSLFLHAEPTPAQFLLYDGWDGVAAVSATRGSASGGDVVYIDGYGLDWQQQYRCTFSRGSQAMDTVGVVRTFSQMSCETPAWGLAYAAGDDYDVEGTVTVSVVKSGVALRYTDHGVVPVSPMVCADAGHLGRCSFEYYPVWSADGNTQTIRINPSSPTVFTAAGGQALHVSGLGFGANLSYVCMFEYQVGHLYSHSVVSVSAEFVNSTLVRCTTPAWEFMAVSAATVSFLVNTTTNSTPSIYQVPLTDAEVPLLVAFEEFYTSVSPTAGGALGGETITVHGLAFNPSTLYSVSFIDAHENVRAAFVSLTELAVQTPRIPGESRNISIFLRYNGSSAVRLVPGWPSALQTSDSLTFTVLAVWTRFSPSHVSRVPGPVLPAIDVHGLGFQQYTNYSCMLSFENSTTTTQATALGTTAISCPVDVLDYQEAWDVEVFATLEVFAGATLLSTTMSQALVELVHVNAQPSFTVARRWIYWMSSMGPFSSVTESWGPSWATAMDSGAPLEAGQTYTFTVTYFPNGWLQDAPTVDVNGTLRFVPTEGRSGVVTLSVLMRDDGGTRSDGEDTSEVQTVHIMLEEEASAPNFLANRTNITVFEDSETVTIPRFLIVNDESDPRVLESFTTKVTPNSHLDNLYFDMVPGVTEEGELVFRAKANVFGLVSYNMTVTFIDAVADSAIAVTRTVTITILPVNDPPSFSLDILSTTFTELDLLEKSQHVVGPVASSVFAGVPTALSGPAGEDWGELTQNVSFVVQVLTGGAFLQAVPSVDVFTDGFNDTYTAIGNLTFVPWPHANGRARIGIALADAGGLATSQRVIDMVVLPVNDEPAFGVNCSSSDAVNCTQNCSGLGLSACSVEIRVDENCDLCQNDLSLGCAAGFSVEGLFQFDASIHMSPDEQSQNLTFSFDLVDGDPLFAQGGWPRVLVHDAGAMTFCLAEDLNGNATFNVTLSDDGGVARGGVNESKVATVALYVHPVNQQPSFSVNESTQSTFFWMNSGNVTVQSFAVDILRGRRDVNGTDRELFQEVSFLVNPSAPMLFQRTPVIDADGMLSFSLTEDVTGMANLTIRLVDDGGTYGLGVNLSKPQFGLFAVVDAYVLLEVGVFPSCSTANWTSELRAHLASVMQVHERWVDIVEDGLYPPYVSFFDPDGTDPVLQLRSGSVGATIRVAGISKPSVVGYLQKWHRWSSDMHDLLPTRCAGQEWIYPRTANAFLVSNLKNEPAVSLASPGVFWMEAETDTVRVHDDFLDGIVAPRDVPIDWNGTEQVIFDLRPIGHKLFRRTSWTMDGTDGGMLTEQPTLTPVCMPVCRNATLQFGHQALWNGEVMYEARMRSTNVTVNFTLTVLPVNQNPSFILYSPIVLLEAPSFRSAAVLYNRSEYAIVEQHGNVTVDAFAFMVIPGPAVEDEQSQNLSFSIELMSSAGSIEVTGAPRLEIAGNQAHLSFDIRQHTSGVLNFTATLTDRGIPAPEIYTVPFSIIVQSVNDEPAFTANCSVSDATNCSQNCSIAGAGGCEVEVRVDENCDFCPEDAVTGCAAGFSLAGLFQAGASLYQSSDEQGQNLSFVLRMLGGDSLFAQGGHPQIVVSADGTLMFCLGEDLNGEVAFNVSLHDDGGVERGGIDMSSVAMLRIIVHPVNQQPSFNVSFDSYVWYWMNSGNNTVADFAVDILRGNRDADGSDREFFQNVTFIETAAEHPIFAAVPTVNATGSLVFSVREETVGMSTFNVTLVDDAGTYGTGQNTSDTESVTVSVMESYSLMYLTVDDVRVDWSGAGGQERLAAIIAAALDIHPNWVVFLDPAHAAHRQLQAAQVLTVQVLAVTSQQALEYASRTRELAQQADSAFAEAGLTRVSVELFRRNFGADPRFEINNSAWSWNESTSDVDFVVPAFAVNMFAPQDVPIDAEGRERVFISVRAVGHRLFLRESWTFDGTDGGLIARQPTLTAVCDPLCKNATLEFGHSALYNGEVMYEASMLTTGFVLNFTITVLPVDQQPSFSMQPVVFVLAEPANASAPGWVTAIDTGPLIEDEQQQTVSFLVWPERDGIKASLQPENASSQARSAVLDLHLFSPEEGAYWFNVTMQDDGTDENGGIDIADLQSFRVESIRINSSATVLENECRWAACQFAEFASDISHLTYLGAPVAYDISITQGDIVVGVQLHRNGTLEFDTLPMRIGNATLRVVLTSNGPVRWSLLYKEITIVVLFVNQPPSFDLTTSRVSAEQGSPLSMVLATNISTGPAAVPPEVVQELTFNLTMLDLDMRTLEAECDVSFCMALAIVPLFSQNPVVSPNGNLELEVEPYGFGAARYNLSLTDDGGTERGGWNQSDAAQFCVVVPPTVRRVPFSVPDAHIYLAEAVGGDQAHELPHFVQVLDASVRNKGVHFEVSAVEEIVPNLPTDQFAAATGGLFLDGAATQLFANRTSLSLDLNGTLSLTLAEQRNGKVRFSITLLDDRGMSCSDSLTFLLEVLPVNQPPTFVLEPMLVLAEPDVDTPVSALVATHLFTGGWAEESQRLFLSFDRVSGSETLLQNPSFSLVGPRNATLDFTIPANRYGNVTLNVTLKDSGGFERGGYDTVRDILTIVVRPVNDEPSFRLTTANIVINRNTGTSCEARLTGVPWVAWVGADSVCSSDWVALSSTNQVPSAARCTPYLDGRLNEHVGIVADVSLGPFEQQSFPGCESLCPSLSSFPACGCEAQNGNFTIEPLDRAGALRMFEVLPRLLLPCAVLTFSPRENEIGSQRFRVALSDSNVLEPGGNLTTPWQYFNITVVGINIIPHFDLVESQIAVLEDAGLTHVPIATNISVDGQGGLYEPGQSITFSVVVLAATSDLFVVGGAPSMTSDGTISFTTTQFAFGNATLLVRIQDDGGTERGGVNVFQRDLQLLVRGVNNAPTYSYMDTITVLQSSGFNSVPSLVFDVVPGPPNEDFQHLTFFVETVSNQNLFLDLPAIQVDGHTGTLHFTLVEGQSGVAHITFHLQDNNGTELGGVDTSVSSTFTVVVEAVNSPPSFGMPWAVSCITAKVFEDGTCTCPVWEPEILSNPDIPPESVCALQAGNSAKVSSANQAAVVTVLEDVGEIRLEGFAVHVTPEKGKLSGSWAHFEMDYHLDELTFSGLLQDDVLSARGMEYAYAVAPSSDDGRLLYVAERETNTLAVFCYNTTTQAACAAQSRIELEGNLTLGNETVVLFDRIAEGLYRFSYDDDAAPISFARQVCGLHRFELGGDVFVAAAAGCWPVDENQTVAPLTLPSSKVYRVDAATHAMVEASFFFPADAVEQILGAASFHAFTRSNVQYLAVAKSIGSSGSLDVTSTIYQLATPGTATQVAAVAGSGAREWLHLQVRGTDYMALASFNGPTYLYPMGSGGTVQDGQKVELLAARATGIKALYSGGETYVIISVYSWPPVDTVFNATNMTNNETYTVREPGPEYPSVVVWLRLQGGQVSPVVVQNLTRAQTVGVEAWEAHGRLFVALAVKSSSTSPVLSSASDREPRFSLLQELPAHVEGVHRYVIDDDDYLAVSQNTSTLLLRWDGAAYRLVPAPNSLPQDLSGGFIVQHGSAAALHLAGSAIPELPDRTGPGSVLLATATGLQLVKGTYEVPITGLNGPTAVVVANVTDGDLVVVASKFSAGISSFMLGSNGVLAHKQTVDCQAQGEAAGGSWTNLAVSTDSQYIFAVSHDADAVAALSVASSNGNLVCVAFLRDGDVQAGAVVDGIQGAQAVAVSEHNQRVYVAGWREAAVAAFAWDPSGSVCSDSLCYVDRIKSGERDVSTFRRDLNESTAARPEFFGVNFPARVGGNGQEWSFSTLDSEVWEYDGVPYLAVCTGTSVLVSEWNPSNASYDIIQEITHDPSPAALKAFVIPDRENVAWQYLAVGTALDSTESVLNPPASIRVFRWNSASRRFVLHHAVSLRLRDGSSFEAGTGNPLPSAVSVAKLEYGKVGDGHYLAAACSHALGYNASLTGPQEARHSYLFRWNPYGSSRLEDGEVGLGAGFATFQVFKERGARDVRILPDIQVISILALAGASGSDMHVAVSRYDRSLFNVDTGSVEGRFDAASALNTPAAVSLASVPLHDYGTVLAVGSPADSASSIEALHVFMWDDTLVGFVSMPGMVDNTCGATSAAGLRFFESGGEVYLLGLQQGDQSGVYQWNRVRQRFGWMLAITDATSMMLRGHVVEDEEIDVHGQCLWFDAGTPLDWEFMPVGETALIVASGTSRGTLAFDFDFDVVTGLRGAAALAVHGSPTGEGEAIWVAGEVDKAFVALNRTCESAIAGCIQFRQVFAEQKLRVSNVRDSLDDDRVQGLSAPRAMYKACSIKYCEDLICGKVCNASVIGGLDRSELQCGPNPPLPSSGAAGALSPPACQNVSFSVEADGSNNAALFVESPQITVDGELHFTLAEKQFGSADFRVSLTDSEGATAPEQHLSIVVVPVNHAPTYEVVPEVSGGRDQDVQSLVFARRVSPGAVNEHEQNISFVLTNNLNPQPPNLFLSPPNLTVVSLGLNAHGVEEWEGRVVWASPPGVTGSATIEFVLVDDGPVLAVRGDESESEAGSFKLSVRVNNAPPTFRIADPVVRIPEDAGMQVFPQFVVDIHPGYDEQGLKEKQVLAFELVEVVSLDTVFDPSLLFTLFNISAEDGTMLFDTEESFNGEYQVFVRLMDDGGTGFFGSNTSALHNFTLIIRANSTMPTWAVLQSSLFLLEQRARVDEELLGVLGNLSALPEDERDQTLSFVVVENNATFLFVQGPDFDLNGTMSVTLNPHRSGVALLGIRLEKSNGQRGEVQYLSVSVEQVNDAPTFALRTLVATLESAGPEMLYDVAYDVLSGPPDEAWQALSFSVMYNSSVSGLFAVPPRIDPQGTLHFTATDGVHGEALLWVSVADDGGVDLGGENASTTHFCRLKVFPTPRVFKVTPRLHSVAGGAQITVEGIFFGSEYSRGFQADEYGSLAVSVGGERCQRVRLVSDVTLLCAAPPGLGRADVEVEVRDGVLTRAGTLEAGVVYSELYYGGVQAVEDGRGAVAIGPRGAEGGATAHIELATSKAVASMMTWGDSLLVGGNFLSVGDLRVNYVAEWDGNDVRPLGHGVDGHVHSLARWGDRAVVAGAFTRALQPNGAAVSTGALAAWNGSGWEDLGCTVAGTISVVAVDGERIYVGGIMSKVCEARCNNIATWDPQLGWRAVGDGVLGGGVKALVVQGNNVYVGGTFVQAGGRPAAKAARWDGQVWHSMGAVGGDVHAMAAFGEYLFAGGEFVTAGGRQASYLARFYSGEWVPVGGGVNGPVFSLQSLNGCVWVGGAFTEARLAVGGPSISARYVVRWCVSAQTFEAVDAGDALGPVRAIQPAMHPLYAPTCPTQAECPADGTLDQAPGL